MDLTDDVFSVALFTFLLINLCHGGLPDLVDPDEDRVKGYDDTHDKLNIQKRNADYVDDDPHPRYKCYKCEYPSCNSPQECTGAASCFTATVRYSNGTLGHARGCNAKTEPFSCTRAGVRSIEGTVQVEGNIVVCCRGDLCNHRNFPLIYI